MGAGITCRNDMGRRPRLTRAGDLSNDVHRRPASDTNGMLGEGWDWTW